MDLSTEYSGFLGEKIRKRLESLETLAASAAQPNETTIQVTTSAFIPATHISHGFIQETPTTVQYTPDIVSGNGDTVATFSDMTTPSSAPISSMPPKATESVAASIVLWDSRTIIDPSHLIVGYRNDYCPSTEITYKAYMNCGCPIRHIQAESKTPHICGRVKPLTFGEDLLYADVYMNHIRVEKICTLSAMWCNCLQLGIEQNVFCDPHSQSPFYRSSGNDSMMILNSGWNISDNVIRTVQNIFKTLKPDLRPTKEQIMIPHHPCYDIFPFPSLRKNILKGDIAADEEELVSDILDGLICWGGSGIGKRDRDTATGRVSSGVPWDVRSWEAKPWFLQKYWHLLGGEDGELVRQSEWWWSMRGEEVELLSRPDF